MSEGVTWNAGGDDSVAVRLARARASQLDHDLCSNGLNSAQADAAHCSHAGY